MGGEVTYLNPHDDGTRADAAPPIGNGSANTIDQVRELLYGEALRGHGRRVDDAHEAVNASEQRILQRFAAMESSIEALTRLLRTEQGAAVRAIGGAITEMGRQIAAMGELHDPRSDHKSG